jgi:putative ABC transport system permease protein
MDEPLPLEAARRPWPRLRSALGFACQGLCSARQRALLALLGVTIGVAAVVALVSLGRGIERQALDEFRALGTQVINVTLLDRPSGPGAPKGPSGAGPRKPLAGEALVAAVAALPEVELVSEVASVSCRGAAETQHPLNAARPELERILGLAFTSGRFMHALDRNELWVVLGAQAARQLGRQAGQPQDPGSPGVQPGAVLSLCGRTLRVAGVLAPMSAAEAVVPMPLDQGLLVSMQAGRRIDPQALAAQLVLRVRPQVSPLEFAPRLSAWLEDQTGQEIQITTARKVLELRRNQAAAATRFLVALSGLSLLVGSLGILNVMLMAVLERRREIGLRLALGADDLDIGLQFLCESLLLGLAGGAAGLVLGVGAAGVAAWAAGLPFVVTPSGMGLALGISVAVGACAGLYPALKAARLLPVAALQ